MQALVALKLCDCRRESRQPLIRMCEINVPHLCDYRSRGAQPRPDLIFSHVFTYDEERTYGGGSYKCMPR